MLIGRGALRADRGEKRGMGLRHSALLLIGGYFSGEDCAFLQTSENRPQSYGGEVRPGWRTQSSIRVLKGRASAGDGAAVVALSHADPPTP